MSLRLFDWLKTKVGAFSPHDTELAPRLEEAETLCAKGLPEEALSLVGHELPEDPELLARFLDLRVRAALSVRDLLCLEGMALHAETLGQLLPDKARLLMLEAEAIGALNLAKALASGVSRSGLPAGEDIMRIQQKKIRRVIDQGYLTIAQTTLAADYEELRLIGLGRTSYVVSARPKAGGNRVAIKFLGPQAYLDEKGIARFKREVEVLARLDHPAILRVLDFHLEEPPYMVTEFFPGADLRKLLEQGRAFFPKETAQIGLALCDAMTHAHSLGIIHRNIQPSNVLMNYQGQIKLIDFGMARLKDQAQISNQGMVLGDWVYMSPEQFAGSPQGPRKEMDLFGIGSTLYNLLAKQPPYTRGVGLQRQRSPDLATLAPNLPGPLLQAIRKAIEEDPMDRWKDPGQMAALLKQVL